MQNKIKLNADLVAQIIKFDKLTGHNFTQVAALSHTSEFGITPKDLQDIAFLCERYRLQSIKPIFENFIDQQ